MHKTEFILAANSQFFWARWRLGEQTPATKGIQVLADVRLLAWLTRCRYLLRFRPAASPWQDLVCVLLDRNVRRVVQ